MHGQCYDMKNYLCLVVFLPTASATGYSRETTTSIFFLYHAKDQRESIVVGVKECSV